MEDMSKYKLQYKEKRKTPKEAAQVVKNGDWVDYGLAVCMPDLLDQALAERKEELNDIKVRGMYSLKPLAIVEADPKRETFTYNSWQLSSYERELHNKGLCNYLVGVYRNIPAFYREYLEVDVAFMMTSSIDQDGYFNFSLINSASKAILDKAKIVVLETNEALPKVYGGDQERIHISEVDFIVEGRNLPPEEVKTPQVSLVDEAIARQIVEQIHDGSNIQLGIGAMPNAIGKMIAKSDLKNLGMHTEMMCDSYLDMHLNGNLTNKNKKTDQNKGVWSVCLGTQRLYDWVRENPNLASYPVDYVNSPWGMAQNDKLISINNCIQVDLYSQVGSESIGQRQISGTGGQIDFLQGAFASNGGKCFLCLASTYRAKDGTLVSRIVPDFSRGSIVSSPRSLGYYMVTEYGMVNLSGRSTWERAEMMISLAHPDFREQLIGEAQKRNIWRNSNKR